MVFRTEVGNNLCIHGGYFRVVGAGRKQYMIHRKYVKKGVHNKVVLYGYIWSRENDVSWEGDMAIWGVCRQH